MRMGSLAMYGGAAVATVMAAACLGLEVLGDVDGEAGAHPTYSEGGKERRGEAAWHQVQLLPAEGCVRGPGVHERCGSPGRLKLTG